jgi:Glycogen recognition site of AMP-activated protein kinase
MIKSRDPDGKASVTFTLPAAVGARKAAICGEWNDWSADAHLMNVVEDGFSLTIQLQVGRTYRFRYLLDGRRWENDWDADFYVPNGYGSDDSVVDLRGMGDAPSPASSVPGPDAPPAGAGPGERFVAAVVRIHMPPPTTAPATEPPGSTH